VGGPKGRESPNSRPDGPAIQDYDGAIVAPAPNGPHVQEGRPMRFGPDDKFWVVTDPTSQSELGDILFQASLRRLELQFKGGLRMTDNPTLFTKKEEAEIEARARLGRVGRL